MLFRSIAAEKSGRLARLIELDPKYVDVIVRRWQDWTGNQATRKADGVPFSEILSTKSSLEKPSVERPSAKNP